MTTAWDIQRARRNRVLLAVIVPPDWKVSMRWSVMNRQLELPPGSDSIQIAGLPYGPARNSAAKAFLDGGYSYLAFLDADTIPRTDWIMRLLDAGRDLIGALYHQRFPPYLPTAFMRGEEPDGGIRKDPLPEFQYGDIIPVDFLATGATLISRMCMETVIAKYPRPYEWGLDLTLVPTDDGKTLPATGEDFMFSLRAKEVGFTPYLHTGVQALHEVSAVVDVGGLKVP
jgi:hypothetical protein